jgi:hypothetical protein
MFKHPKSAGPTARFLVCLLAAALCIVTAPAANAAPPAGGGTQQTLGNDVSWPQCNKALPKDPAFAIVGVNNGLANTTNPCLQAQLKWAQAIPAGRNSTGQPTIALYVNTANPGLAGSWWTKGDQYPEDSNVTVDTNPYGSCKNNPEPAGAACAYMYGYAKAYDDAKRRGISSPESYLWWLDVETGNSWSGTNLTANRAVLEGMTDFFQGIGADVGIYSTSYQWGQIVGSVSDSSNLYTLPSWLAGARTLTGAKSNCSNPPLTAGGSVTLTQFVSKGFDYDYSCI